MQYKTDQGVQSENAALDIRGLSMDYIMQDQNIHAVVDLNLVARMGKITALVGESGSGKSTVALAVMDIQDKNAVISSGEIYLGGTDILSMPKKDMRSYISNHVLDVGCGPGFFTIMLARLKHNVTSVDGAEGMVERARINIKKEALNTKIYKGDAVLLDKEKEASLDAIVSRDVVWTLYDPEKAFIRWKNLLKTDGKIVIYDGDYRRDQSSLRYHESSLCFLFLTLFPTFSYAANIAFLSG